MTSPARTGRARRRRTAGSHRPVELAGELPDAARERRPRRHRAGPGDDLPGEDLPGDDLPGDDLPGDEDVIADPYDLSDGEPTLDELPPDAELGIDAAMPDDADDVSPRRRRRARPHRCRGRDGAGRDRARPADGRPEDEAGWLDLPVLELGEPVTPADGGPWTDPLDLGDDSAEGADLARHPNVVPGDRDPGGRARRPPGRAR